MRATGDKAYIDAGLGQAPAEITADGSGAVDGHTHCRGHFDRILFADGMDLLIAQT
jgi:hypothetical protein